MLSIVLNWIYVTVTIFPVGYFVAHMMEKYFNCNLKKIDEILMSGLILVTVYAQIVSLFYKVSFEANLILCLVALCVYIKYRKGICKLLGGIKGNIKWGRSIFFLILAVVICYFTSRGYEHYDTGLYHGQAIRWIEEYGVVPGLGNLNYRIAYNSSAFVLTALYSMKFLVGQSLHTLSGYFLCIMCLPIVFREQKTTKWKICISDLCGVAGLYYVTIAFASLNSPASDYFVSAVIIYLIIKYIQKIECKEKNVAVFAWISLISCFAITLKISALPVVLIVLYPMVKLLKDKDWKKIAIFISLGLIIVLPFLIRGIIISGWLLYPNTAIDLFSFDFKVNEQVAYYDQLVIMLWGRSAEIGDTFVQWFPKWVASIDGRMEQILMLLSAIGFLSFLFVWVYEVKKKQIKLWHITLDVTVIMGFCFWFFTAPLIRYGAAYILLLIGVAFGRLLQHITSEKIHKIVVIGIVAILLYKGKSTYDLGRLWIGFDSYIWQQDYAMSQVEEVEYDGITFYVIKHGDQVGYHYFPMGSENPTYELRGDTLKDGFREK